MKAMKEMKVKTFEKIEMNENDSNECVRNGVMKMAWRNENVKRSSMAKAKSAISWQYYEKQ